MGPNPTQVPAVFVRNRCCACAGVAVDVVVDVVVVDCSIVNLYIRIRQDCHLFVSIASGGSVIFGPTLVPG